MAKNEEGKGKGKGNIIIIAILLVLVVGAGTFAGTYLFMKNNKDTDKQVEEIKVPVAEDLTVNLSDSGNRYLKTTVYIYYDKENKDIAEEITNKTIEIQDKTSLYLKSKTAEDFDASKEETLKKELSSEINSILNKGEIENVYFPKGLLVQ